jgi:hypothetical protein
VKSEKRNAKCEKRNTKYEIRKAKCEIRSGHPRKDDPTTCAAGLVRNGKEHRQECLCYLKKEHSQDWLCHENMGLKQKRLAGGEAQY